MKILTRSKLTNIGLAALLAVGIMFSLAQNAKAAGTASNTTISNSATLDYSVSGVSQTSITSAAATFVVDNKVNLTVAKVADANVVPSALKQALAFTVTNNGNTTQRYALSVTAGAENFTTDIASTTIYLDVNANNAWDSGDTLYVDASTFGNVAADGSLKILIVADITTPNANGQAAAFNLVATTVTLGTITVTAETTGADTSGVDVVFADIAGSATGDGARNGAHSVAATYTIASAAITVSKTATLLCDPFNGVTNPKNIPGSITQWTIAISNGSGSADAKLTTITDTLASTLAHEIGTSTGLTAPSNAATCVAGAGQLGFRVTAGAARGIGTCAATLSTCNFTTNTVDGLDISGQTITATFATILPTDANHASTGLLKANETVSIIFNTILQ